MLKSCYEPCYVPTYLYFLLDQNFCHFLWFSIQNSQFEINSVSKISFVDAFLYQDFIFVHLKVAKVHLFHRVHCTSSYFLILWHCKNYVYEINGLTPSRTVRDVNFWLRSLTLIEMYLGYEPGVLKDRLDI